MHKFENDGERLEFALLALRNIYNWAADSNLDDGLIKAEIASIAHNTIRIIEDSQKEPATDINDLLLEIHDK